MITTARAVELMLAVKTSLEFQVKADYRWRFSYHWAIGQP
jgi:hypothetical protein